LKVTVVDPNADLKAATLEHTHARAEWRDARRRAEARCGYSEAEASSEAMGDEMDCLYCMMSALTATGVSPWPAVAHCPRRAI
jgi:hypothetical protein